MPADDECRESAPRGGGRDGERRDSTEGTENRGFVGEYDKLVRDGIPAVVRADGNRPVTRRVDGAEYDRYLAAKVREEADEVVEAVGELDDDDVGPSGDDDDVGLSADDDDANPGGDDDDAVLDELADVYAVLAATVEARGRSMTAVRERAREKADARGGFADGIVLERIDPSASASSDATGVQDDDGDTDRS